MVKEEIELAKLRGEFENINKKRSNRIKICVVGTFLLTLIIVGVILGAILPKDTSDGIVLSLFLIPSLLSCILGYKLYKKIFWELDKEWDRLYDEIKNKEEMKQRID